MITESVNPDSLQIDEKDSLGIVQIMNRNDQQVAFAVEKVLPEVALAVDHIVDAFKNGGRLFYIGAGTSGRLGIVDASECPPTFGVEPEMVQGIIAGGNDAVFQAKEFAEDDQRQGWLDLQARGFTAKDIVVGLTTSGRTPYTCGALQKAREIGAVTIAVFCNPDGKIREFADVSIVPVVGPEVVTGSTRLKAGTAEKMVLNMLTTAAMIRTGRVIGNLLADMKISCEKLQHRAVALLVRLTKVDDEKAKQALEQANGVIRSALQILQEKQ